MAPSSPAQRRLSGDHEEPVVTYRTEEEKTRSLRQGGVSLYS